MAKRIDPMDLIGFRQENGQLLVVDYDGHYVKDGTSKRKHYYKCICYHEDIQSWVTIDEVIDRDSIKTEHTKSCGCLNYTKVNQIFINPEDLIGFEQIDGQLLVIQYDSFYIKDGTTTKLHYYWCMCWHEEDQEWVFVDEPIDRVGIKTDNTRSCGCLYRLTSKDSITKANQYNKKRYNDKLEFLIGTKIKDFLILSANAGEFGTVVSVMCFCGEIFEAYLSQLKSRDTKSCGCLYKLKEGNAAFNERFTSLMKGAKRRNHVFILTKQEVKEIIFKPCEYCSSEGREYWSRPDLNGGFVGNSLDQKNPGQGYTQENIASCCHICNRLKSNLSWENWLQKLIRISKINYNNLIFDCNFKEIVEDQIIIFRKLFQHKKSEAKCNGTYWDLTEREFYNLVTSNCFYCGIEPSNLMESRCAENYQGIDKINPNKGYTWINVVPCCANCNFGKGTMSQDEFINHLRKIQIYQLSIMLS